MTKREFLDIVFALAPTEANAIMDAFDEYVDSNEPHWIPVTERLPNKEEKSYWVCLEGGGQCQCRWTNDVYGLGVNEWSKWGWKKVDLPQFSKVVAYMPLPEPYKGGRVMVDFSECTRKNFCVECDDPDCLLAGEVEADCPKWKCDNPTIDCENCEFLKEYKREVTE